MANEENPLERIERVMREQAAETGHPGLEIRREDGFLLAKSVATPEQQEEWRLKAAEYRATLPATMRARAENLDKMVLQFDPLDVIAHVAWINALHDAEDWDEHQFEGNDAYIEYIVLLCLTHEYGEFETSDLERSMQLDGMAIQEEIKRLFQLSVQEDQLESANSEAVPDPIEELRFMTLMHEVGVRYPGSNSHLHEVLSGMLSPLSADLSAELGFGIEEALALDKSISAHLNKKLIGRMKQAGEFERNLRKAVKRYRQKQREDDRFDKELVRRLASMRPTEAAEQARRFAVAWLYFAFGNTMSFTHTELAEAAGVSEAVARSFLDFFSLEFGSVERRYRLPCPTHPLQSRPIIRLQDGQHTRYFCPVWQAVPWALRPRLEEELTRELPAQSLPRLASLYSARRSDYCEQKAFELLKHLLKPDEGCAHMSAKYQRAVEGKQREFEIDGLFLIDHVLILLEAKSGGMRPSARRGGLRSMESDIESLVGNASEQTAAAWAYLSESTNPTLELGDGTRWQVPMEKVHRVFRVCVTLEDLTVFVTNMRILGDMDMVDLRTPFWAVSIYDLLVLRDLIETPAVFVHYLAARHAVEQMGCVHAYCELDHFGCYLAGDMPYGPAPINVPENTRVILDPTYSSIIDNWYFFLDGARRTAPRKPERAIPNEFRTILNVLERKRPDKYLEVSCILLDLPDAGQAELAFELNRLRSQCALDGKTHDTTIRPPGWSLGITIMASPTMDMDELAKSLGSYCSLKKYQQRCDCWLGLGSLSWADEPVQMVILLDDPWAADPAMDELVRDALPSEPPTTP